MSEISYIQKDSNVMGRYKAISHDKVISEIRKFLVINGIVIEATQIKNENQFHTIPPTSSSKNPQYIYIANYRVSFVNIDNPDDKINVDVEAHSTCVDDKSPGKTYSYAIKYAILKTFCIETGIDEESPNKKSIVNRDKTIENDPNKFDKYKKKVSDLTEKNFQKSVISIMDQAREELSDDAINSVRSLIQVKREQLLRASK